jgi:Mn2+/Fe2+ NRAMP family transporter
MAAAARLLLLAPAAIYVTVFGLLSLALQVFVPYTRYVKYLKWLTVALFSYVATALLVKVPWLEVLIRTIRPAVTLNASYLMALVAVLGTTISPYLFVWQASQEVEEVNTNREEQPLQKDPRQARQQLGRIRADTLAGMAASNAVAFFIILTTAATLHASGQTDVTSAEQAAKALEPLAGRLATWLFAAGIIGTGLLAVPVLAGSAHQAQAFYGVIAAATLIGLSLNFMHFDPIKALFWAAVVNGVVAVPLMVVIMLMGSNSQVMGRFVLPRILKIFGWLATAVMLATVCGSLISML